MGVPVKAFIDKLSFSGTKILRIGLCLDDLRSVCIACCLIDVVCSVCLIRVIELGIAE